MAGLERRLRVDLAGAVDREQLDRLRELLGLTPAGRLTDREDALFGSRDTGGGAVPQRSLGLWRDGEESWSVSLSAPRGSEVDDAELDRWAREAEAAAVAAGLRVVGRRMIAPKPARSAAVSDVDVHNEDWLRSAGWDLPARRLDELWPVLGLSGAEPDEHKRAVLRAFTATPAWQPAPAPLRAEARAFLEGETG
ncbi:hypothetical protein L6E12_27645 [Actinokineospora sp. PR83]|uniref:hypothetical protein n=1 Tax=Actinokineospora sp. PR83 TaxID=2884908 RepID=UPI001F2BEDA5|nr:hypothetical protein [Actinokineospora sp. PR83]MCG8919553.1 hypothetical protein [Actinokineospora sp. PR83]